MLQQTILPLFLMVGTLNAIVPLWFIARYCQGNFATYWHQYVVRTGSYKTMLKGAWSKTNVWSACFDGFAVSLVGCYFIWAIILMKLLKGQKVEGPLTPKGNTPVYVDNGLKHYAITYSAFVILTVVLKLNGFSPTIIYDRYGDVLCFLGYFSLIFCLGLYVKGRFFPSTSDCSLSGNPIFDYYWGTELHPRVLGIDIKVLTNCRFGMTVWPLLISVFALKSYEKHGFIDSIWVTVVLQLVYITKFFYWEAGYMKTIDIATDRAGYYICWGCLSFIPGFYTLTVYYMVNHPLQLGLTKSLGLLLFGLACIAINYWTDYQRQIVRETDGNTKIWGKIPEIIRVRYKLETGEERNSLLLVSGFWRFARHFNYLVELLLTAAWTVPAGFTNVMPYCYLIYLIILLTHRVYRDDAKCKQKYGKFWDEYCKLVPWKVIPYVW